MTDHQTARRLAALDQVLILTHRRPDGDTIGCASALCLALRQLGKTAWVLPNEGAHLDHIHLLKQGQVPDIHELCDNGQPRGLFGLQQQADALLSQPLEVIGRGPGLERAPPQEGGPGLFDLLGHIGDLLLRLHRAGAGDEGKMAPADGRGPRLNDRVLRVERPVDRLEGVGDPGHRLHNVQALDHLHIHLGGVADEPQNCLVLPLGDMDP